MDRAVECRWAHGSLDLNIISTAFMLQRNYRPEKIIENVDHVDSQVVAPSATSQRSNTRAESHSRSTSKSRAEEMGTETTTTIAALGWKVREWRAQQRGFHPANAAA